MRESAGGVAGTFMGASRGMLVGVPMGMFTGAFVGVAAGAFAFARALTGMPAELSTGVCTGMHMGALMGGGSTDEPISWSRVKAHTAIRPPSEPLSSKGGKIVFEGQPNSTQLNSTQLNSICPLVGSIEPEALKA